MSNFSTDKSVHNVMEQSYDRPLGVSLLAVILMIGGITTLVMQIMAWNTLNDASTMFGVSSHFLQGAIAFLGLLGCAAAVGLWIGKSWGWWLALLYFAYAVTRNMTVILSISNLADQFNVSGQETGSYYLKYGVRMLWNGCLMYYLCRGEMVLSYLQTERTNKWKALGIVFVISIVPFVVVAFT
ncbi:hypothetical protein [Paenibacillus terrigena]|uniref:hypothetical protein n=1 Tax=Paenibacillus terrigena TaxID=369333 RepID=UPI0003808E0E|nr:hypothetical protein [Paenibacillus terrigena]